MHRKGRRDATCTIPCTFLSRTSLHTIWFWNTHDGARHCGFRGLAFRWRRVLDLHAYLPGSNCVHARTSAAFASILYFRFGHERLHLTPISQLVAIFERAKLVLEQEIMVTAPDDDFGNMREPLCQIIMIVVTHAASPRFFSLPLPLLLPHHFVPLPSVRCPSLPLISSSPPLLPSHSLPPSLSLPFPPLHFVLLSLIRLSFSPMRTHPPSLKPPLRSNTPPSFNTPPPSFNTPPPSFKPLLLRMRLCRFASKRGFDPELLPHVSSSKIVSQARKVPKARRRRQRDRGHGFDACVISERGTRQR
eukprot:821617-Pleurochrysis_carterae.AAC.1